MSDGDAEGEVTPRASHRASSPERTPGRSPEGHVAFLVQEAEERSQRRAAAIRHVLDSIRIAPPLPSGRRVESPTADFEAALVDSEGDSGGGVRSSQESTTLEELLPRVAPQAVTGPDNPQEMLEVWKTRCERLEKALESCQLEAQESLETSQAELAAVEGRVAKREAELSMSPPVMTRDHRPQVSTFQGTREVACGRQTSAVIIEGDTKACQGRERSKMCRHRTGGSSSAAAGKAR